MMPEGLGESLSRLLAVPARWFAAGIELALQVIGPSDDRRPERAPAAERTASSRPRRSQEGGAVAFDQEVIPALRATPTQVETEPDEEATDPASPPLPDGPAIDRLVLLPRTPESAFAFWDPSEKAGRGPHAALRLRIRSRRVGAQEEHGWDERALLLAPAATSQYITGLEADTDVLAALGYEESDRFVEIAVSGLIRMPPRRPHQGAESRWRDHATGTEVSGYEAIAGTTPTSPGDLSRNLPPPPPSGTPVAVTTPAPNPRAVPARR